MIQITPFSVGFPVQKEANHIFIKPLISSTTADKCSTYWELLKVVEVIEEDIVVRKEITLILKGNTDISPEEYALWADDNKYLENLVLTKLGLTRL